MSTSALQAHILETNVRVVRWSYILVVSVRCFGTSTNYLLNRCAYSTSFSEV